jgi:DNA-binding MarR family transcriptional regulator
VPRLDATRIGVWRDLRVTVDEIARRIDDDLRSEWDISLGWFDVLSSLQRSGGSARPLDVAADLRLPASSISRRLDRLEEEGWIARHRYAESSDLRAVEVELTRTGRRLWREMNVSFRRSVQAHFAVNLDDTDVAALRAIMELLDEPADGDEDEGDDVGAARRAALPTT